MKVRLISATLVVLVGLTAAVPAQADWLEQFFDGVCRDTKRNNCWPEPFTRPDRASVRAPFAVMVNNGWRCQNMLGDHHFDDDLGQLTEAGRQKIRWILTEAPQHHRTVYVHRATSGEQTTARINAVRQIAMQFSPDGQVPLVLETNTPSEGWPADHVDAITRKFQASMPEPRIRAIEAVDDKF